MEYKRCLFSCTARTTDARSGREGNHARVGATEPRGARASVAKAAMVRHVAKAATADPAAKAKGGKAAMALHAAKADTTGQDGKANGAKEVTTGPAAKEATPGTGPPAVHRAYRMALKGHPQAQAADSSLVNAKAASPGRVLRKDPQVTAEGAATGADTIGALTTATAGAQATAAVISEDPKAKAASAGTSAPAS